METDRSPSLLKIVVILPLAAGIIVAAAVAIASRLQLSEGRPGVLMVTVPVPALVLLLVALAAACTARSFRFGLLTGLWALLASFVALLAVLAVEGPVWMERHGVFMLDGDPPRKSASTVDVVMDIFSTGMWSGHLALWVPAVLMGAALGAWIGGRMSSPGQARQLAA